MLEPNTALSLAPIPGDLERVSPWALDSYHHLAAVTSSDVGCWREETIKLQYVYPQVVVNVVIEELEPSNE